MNLKNTLLAFSALLITGASFGAIRATTPTVWPKGKDSWQMDRHNAKMEIVKAGGAKVVFIGDSITHNWEKAGKKQLEKYFSKGDMKMLNLGTGADRTEHVLWRIKNGELDGYEAKCIVVMIGTNNTGHHSIEKEPPMDTILGIREILTEIRKKQPKATIVLSAIFPRGKDASDAKRIRNEIVNKEICKFCDGETIFWCDFNDEFLNDDGTLPKDLFPDYLHPTGPGYEIWYKAVKPYIDYALSDRKGEAPKNRYSKKKAEPKSDKPTTIQPVARVKGMHRPRNYDVWTQKLFTNRRIISNNKEIDIVFAGDSITHLWGFQGKEEYSKLLKKYSILNIGYSGDRTQHLLWRGLYGELDGYKAKCVMLMIGTNNSGGNTPEEVALGVRTFLDLLAKKQPQAKVILLPIFPRGDAKDWRRTKNNKVNEIIKTYADGEKIVWVDFTDKFLDENGDTKWIMPDRLHPELPGYKIWAEAVMPYFQKFCGK